MDEKWQFVHDVQGGWWLRLTSDEDIVRYIQTTNDRYDGAMCKAVHSPLESMSLEEKIKTEQSGDRNYKLLQAGMIMALWSVREPPGRIWYGVASGCDGEW